jgi:hypothetical protein
MKTAVKISNVLSWINIIVWGLVILEALVIGLASGVFLYLILAFFLSSVILHSYAALKLRKSIRNPDIPLGSQTPAGIRFIGFVALLFGASCLANGITILQNAKESLKFMQAQMPQLKDMNVSYMRSLGAVAVLVGLSVAGNVFINFRLLRWYQFSKANSEK